MKSTRLMLNMIVLLTFIVGAALYPIFPDLMAVHWNASGVANGMMPRFWGVFLLPLMMTVFVILREVILRVDPFKKNIKSFQKYFDLFWLLLILFFDYLFVLMMLWNIGYQFNFTLALIPALALFFFGIGEVMEHTKRNWFMGIRTPWTLSSEKVWNKTHALAGKLFKFSAFLTLLGIIFPGPLAFGVMIVSLLLSVFITILYSFLEFQKNYTR